RVEHEPALQLDGEGKGLRGIGGGFEAPKHLLRLRIREAMEVQLRSLSGGPHERAIHLAAVELVGRWAAAAEAHAHVETPAPQRLVPGIVVQGLDRDRYADLAEILAHDLRRREPVRPALHGLER